MATLSQAILAPDTLANRPAAGSPGRLFYAIDTQLLYRDTGSGWDTLVMSAGGAPAQHDHTGASDGGVLTNDKHDGYSEYQQIASPSTPASNSIRVYAKDKGGTATLYYKDEAGTEYELPTIVTGGGGAGSGAPADAPYVTIGSVAALSGETPFASLILKNNIALRPAAGVDGRLFYANDENILYRDNGTTWQTLPVDWTNMVGSKPTLDQITAPAADVSLNSHKITNLATPTASGDAATKGYVDGLTLGLSWKASVRAASTANVTLSSAVENGDTLDGVTLATGNRILLKNQTTGSENGIYTVNASGAPTRATDADSGAELLQAAVFVEEGTVNGDTAWVCTTNGPITAGSTALTFAQFSGVGSGTITVREIDGSPSVTASVIEVTNGKLTDQGSGVARLDLSGGGGGGGATISDGTYASRPAGTEGDLSLSSDGYSAARKGASAWEPWGPLFRFTIPPAVSGWTWVNQGTAVATDDRDGILLTAPTSSGTNVRGIFRSAPSTPYTITAALLAVAPALNFINFGLAFRQSSDGKIHLCGLGTSTSVQFVSLKFTNATTFSANYTPNFAYLQVFGPVLWLRLADDGANRIFSVSLDGRNWKTVHSVGRTDFLTADQVGVVVDVNNTSVTPDVNLLSWAVG